MTEIFTQFLGSLGPLPFFLPFSVQILFTSFENVDDICITFTPYPILSKIYILGAAIHI